MNPVFVNRCRTSRLPRKFLADWVARLSQAREFRGHRRSELVIVFVDAPEMKRLNSKYRGKKYATDVLSFEAVEPGSLGELVLCPEVLRAQSEDTGLSFRHELGYMIVHGCLHLLGHDHERHGVRAKKMFALQERMFRRLTRYFPGRPSSGCKDGSN